MKSFSTEGIGVQYNAVVLSESIRKYPVSRMDGSDSFITYT